MVKKLHVAFKCTYNNGGEGIRVGFQGRCSDDIIKWNIESGRVWCGQPDCECKKYYDRGFRGEKPLSNPCYESVLFEDWKYGAGSYHTGSRAGTAKYLRHVGVGKIAILTTLFPSDRYLDRRIMGLFRIGAVVDDPETFVVADEDYRINLRLDEAKKLFFWEYYDRKPWGSHLHRYLDDAQVAQILRDVRDTVRDAEIKQKVDALLSALP